MQETTMTRPPKTAYFLQIAAVVSTRTTCLAEPVGAVLVKDGQILSTGYNGVPSGQPHCTDQGYCYDDIKDCSKDSRPSRAIHAEMNAIAQAAKHGVNTNEAHLYITKKPCENCMKLIRAAGIAKIVFPEADSVVTTFLA